MRRPRAGQAAGHSYAVAASFRFAPGSGPAGDASGPRPPPPRTPVPVLMLHGLGGDSGQLWPYAGGDAARSRLAPDLRAHGATMLVGQRSSFTFGGLTRDLAALLDRLRFPPAVVVGMSMAAGVAVSLALRRISVPAVVVGTPSDPPHPFEIARIWASALPASRLVAAPARDMDPAGYQACLTEACGQLAGHVDGERTTG